jgi:hypothetical protein
VDNDVIELVEKCAGNYARMLKLFSPCKPGSEFLEQNIITLFAHEFLMKWPNGAAFSEVPFISDIEKDHWFSRLDSFLLNDEIGYAIEVKGSQSKDELFKLIEEDLIRLKSEELKISFHKMATGGVRDHHLPKKIIGLVLADFWYDNQAEKWINNNTEFAKELHISKIDTMKVKIGDFGKYQYFLLAGQLDEGLITS